MCFRRVLMYRISLLKTLKHENYHKTFDNIPHVIHSKLWHPTKMITGLTKLLVEIEASFFFYLCWAENWEIYMENMTRKTYMNVRYHLFSLGDGIYPKRICWLSGCLDWKKKCVLCFFYNPVGWNIGFSNFST